MLRELWKGYQGGSSLAELQALCARLIGENDRLRLENARVRAENRTLRRRLADRELRVLRRAEADASFVGMLRFAQLPTSRAACEELGLSRRRWAWANALLDVARLRVGGVWRDVTLDEYEAGLRRAVALVERDGAQLLKIRLPRNGARGLHRTRPRPVTRTGPFGARNGTAHKSGGPR